MRLLNVIDSFAPETGGTLKAMLEFNQELVKQGHVIESLAMGPKPEILPSACGEFHVVGERKSVYGYDPLVLDWLKENVGRFDAVIAHGVWQFHTLATRLACAKQGTPYFVYVHGMLDPWFKHTYPLKHIKKWFYWPWGEYLNLKNARAVFYTGEDEKALARQSFWLYHCREEIVPLGIEPPIKPKPAIIEQFRSATPGLDDAPYLLFLGRIYPKKGADILIEAYRQLRKESVELPHLVVAGPVQDDSFKSTLLGLAEDDPHIHFHEMVQGDQKWGAIAGAGALILPSHQENFGIVVAEALGLGVPALISDKVNIWREVVDDQAGLAEVDTVAGVRDLLTKWCALTDDQRFAMSASAQLAFNKRYDITQATDHLISVLDRCLSN
ncbi:MAG: glycosyltransferase [Verrucomicrobiota bacterium]